ncbi:hypothetical protein ACHAXM_003366, partial [Skeletonema potamos]
MTSVFFMLICSRTRAHPVKVSGAEARWVAVSAACFQTELKWRNSSRRACTFGPWALRAKQPRNIFWANFALSLSLHRLLDATLLHTKPSMIRR